VFTRSDSSWEQQAYLKASNTETRDFFGHAVSISADGNTLAIGARGEDSASTGINGDQGDNTAFDAGAVYNFGRTNGVWLQEDYIKASLVPVFEDSGIQRIGFGTEVSISGDGNTLAVSAPGENSSAKGINGIEADSTAMFSGAVYVFKRIDGIWQQSAYVKASNTNSGDGFGDSLSLSTDGSAMAIGTAGEDSAATGINADDSDNSGGNVGAVFLY